MQLTPELLLKAYSIGIFPMAEGRNDPELHWIDPELRGILPLEDFHIPRRLKRSLRKNPFEMRCNSAFDQVLQACAAPADNRPDTWINPTIERLYGELYKMGCAHSVECWRGDALVGGLYGVSLGGAFFGESMFSRATDASKVALVHLVLRMKKGGMRLLDTQFTTPHLSQFGVVEIPREAYRTRLSAAINAPVTFFTGTVSDAEVLAFLDAVG